MICRNIYCEHWVNFECNHLYEIIINEDGKCVFYETADLSAQEMVRRSDIRREHFPLPKKKGE